MECSDFYLNIFDFGVVTEIKGSLLGFLFKLKVMSRYSVLYVWENCRNGSRERTFHALEILYMSTWLEYCYVQIKTATRLTAMWMLTNPPRHNVTMESLALAGHIVFALTVETNILPVWEDQDRWWK
ncbi:hypothetical protein RF11_12419 [Thelohanellus kitauei]|uniref:Uncharacterized protein n=1 Tax=Thelohanellus kitauei TaxID=669202 RepID=A0A0C2NE81_THEKT|nr:hypothetical protein RF11_12419 [Thelohanellus kitauei]